MLERRKRHNFYYQIALNLQTVRAVARLQNKTRQFSSAEGASRKGGGGLGACSPENFEF